MLRKEKIPTASKAELIPSTVGRITSSLYFQTLVNNYYSSTSNSSIMQKAQFGAREHEISRDVTP